MIDFKPAPDYEGLKKQACALHTLAEIVEKRATYESNMVAILREELEKVDQREFDALRDVNEKLTNECEAKDQRIAELEASLKWIKACLDGGDISHIDMALAMINKALGGWE